MNEPLSLRELPFVRKRSEGTSSAGASVPTPVSTLTTVSPRQVWFTVEADMRGNSYVQHALFHPLTPSDPLWGFWKAMTDPQALMREVMQHGGRGANGSGRRWERVRANVKFEANEGRPLEDEGASAEDASTGRARHAAAAATNRSTKALSAADRFKLDLRHAAHTFNRSRQNTLCRVVDTLEVVVNSREETVYGMRVAAAAHADRIAYCPIGTNLTRFVDLADTRVRTYRIPAPPPSAYVCNQRLNSKSPIQCNELQFIELSDASVSAVAVRAWRPTPGPFDTAHAEDLSADVLAALRDGDGDGEAGVNLAEAVRDTTTRVLSERFAHGESELHIPEVFFAHTRCTGDGCEVCQATSYVILDLAEEAVAAALARLRAVKRFVVVPLTLHGPSAPLNLRRVKCHEVRGPKFDHCLLQLTNAVLGPCSQELLHLVPALRTRTRALHAPEHDAETRGAAYLLRVLVTDVGLGDKNMRTWPLVAVAFVALFVCETSPSMPQDPPPAEIQRRLLYHARHAATDAVWKDLVQATTTLAQPAKSYVSAAVALYQWVASKLGPAAQDDVSVEADFVRDLGAATNEAFPSAQAAPTAVSLKADTMQSPHTMSACLDLLGERSGQDKQDLLEELCTTVDRSICYGGASRPGHNEMVAAYGAFYWSRLHADPATQAVPSFVAAALLDFFAVCGVPMAEYYQYQMRRERCRKRRIIGDRKEVPPWAQAPPVV